MKILHTSDLHIGKRVNEFSMIEEQKYILKEIENIAKEEKIDVLILAGDIYDRSIPPVEAVEVLDNFLERFLVDMNIPVVMISGNHDSAERLSFGKNIMKSKGLHIKGEYEMEATKVSIGEADFYLFPYVDPAVVRKKTEDPNIKTHNDAMKYLVGINKELDRKKINIALYHGYVTSTSGNTLKESDSERRLSIGGTDEVSDEIFKEFDYVALGHLHGPQRVGSEKIRYSGSPLKYSFSEENHKKSVTIAEFQQQKETIIKTISLKIKRDMVTVKGTMEELLKGKAVADRSSYLRVQLGEEEVIDPMNKLRQVYPNVMILEKKEIFQSTNLEKKDIKTIKKTEITELFGEFYQETYGEDMTEEELKIIQRISKSCEGGEA